jgi:proline dehydrogenase
MAFRSPFHSLIDNKLTRGMLQRSGSQNPMVRRYIAGDQISDALQAGTILRESQFHTSFDYLGPDALNAAEIKVQIDQYHEEIKAISTFSPEADLLVRLSSIGMLCSKEDAANILEQILTYAKERNVYVRVAQESADYIEDAVEIVGNAAATHKGLGFVLQANLRRTESDLQKFEAEGNRICLTKGTGTLQPIIGFNRPDDIDRQFRRHMFELMHSGKEHNVVHSICTHDPAMIEAAKVTMKKEGIDPKLFEFEFLYGVRPDLQSKMVDQGYTVNIQVPYGDNWYPYFSERVGEKPS